VAILALDVGERRIGVAISDPSETFALPLPVIERVALREDLATIVRIAAERTASTIVVGDPLTLAGTRSIAAEKIDRFCAALARSYGGAIARADERLTTAQATRTLISADVSRAKRKRTVDGIAAALILETYLAGRRRGVE
jgi:putative Holliday junction resolvase